ncbi:cold-shock protein [Leptospira kmetyi]|uniref:cold-shock protein n=1 Tax=Leptospira kmetyi TaxID=408139 RepID=UPI0002F32FFE|nr:cold shock domain-containing protein [Leptospira kmetyi]EQA55392.1 cold-shock DNA-binding domain protein [Leptospira kmetyi serovar Malaysia str. Bejo-Iso9]
METKSKLLTGTIRRYIPWNQNLNKGGYGFIETENQRSYFFNAKYSNIREEEIQNGTPVEFETRRGFDKVKGVYETQATRVRRI